MERSTESLDQRDTLPTAVITSKGQVTIPKAIRDQVRLRVGDRVRFVVRDGDIVIKPPPPNLLDLQGSVEHRERPEDLDHVRETVKRRRGEKLAEGE